MTALIRAGAGLVTKEPRPLSQLTPPLSLVQQQSAPHCCPVGRLPGTDIFRDAIRFPQAIEVH